MMNSRTKAMMPQPMRQRLRCATVVYPLALMELMKTAAIMKLTSTSPVLYPPRNALTKELGTAGSMGVPMGLATPIMAMTTKIRAKRGVRYLPIRSITLFLSAAKKNEIMKYTMTRGMNGADGTLPWIPSWIAVAHVRGMETKVQTSISAASRML